MESNNCLLSHQLQIRIQGLVGELVALDYVLKNLKKDPLDEIIITTNRCNKLKSTQSATQNPMHPYYSHIYNKNPTDFLQDDFVDKLLKIGCEGIDLRNADIEAKNLFEEYVSKAKEYMLSELDQLYNDYKKEREIETLRESQKTKNINHYQNNELISEKFKTLSDEDLAKVLTLIELERCTKKKKIFETDTSVKMSSLVTFSHLLIYPFWEVDYKRSTLKNISKYVNSKYEELNIVSSVFRCIIETKTIIDSMIVHRSAERTLKKLIMIECKTGNSPLTKNQKAFIDCIKQIKSDKVEYKVINVDYQAPEQLIVSEISD